MPWYLFRTQSEAVRHTPSSAVPHATNHHDPQEAWWMMSSACRESGTPRARAYGPARRSSARGGPLWAESLRSLWTSVNGGPVGSSLPPPHGALPPPPGDFALTYQPLKTPMLIQISTSSRSDRCGGRVAWSLSSTGCLGLLCALMC